MLSQWANYSFRQMDDYLHGGIVSQNDYDKYSDAWMFAKGRKSAIFHDDGEYSHQCPECTRLWIKAQSEMMKAVECKSAGAWERYERYYAQYLQAEQEHISEMSSRMNSNE